MPMKPNYRFERAERDRAKQAKKDEKSRRQRERVGLRRDNDAAETPDERKPPHSSGH
jgi:hypothetical protein